MAAHAEWPPYRGSICHISRLPKCALCCLQINAHSSRSHCLLIITVTGTNTANGVRTVGKLTLCDLAGSERINKTGATGVLTPQTLHLSHIC